MFRNLQIWAKFAAVLSVPLIGLAILMGIGISRSLDVADRSNQTEQVATFDNAVTTLIHELRLEEFVTELHLAGKPEAIDALRGRQWQVSEQAAAAVRTQAPSLTMQPGSPLATAYERSLGALDELAAIREQVDADDANQQDTAAAYRAADQELVTVRLLAVDTAQDRLTAIATDLRGLADATVFQFSIAVVIVLLLALGISLPMASFMVRSLHRLRDASLEVAERSLPKAVARLQSARSMEELEVQASPVAIRSRDEIGQVGNAFNAVHQVAVQIAVEQGALRRSIGDLFMNLARRSQSLIDRQISLIDSMERSEQDPESLEGLFKLDHLATRMRRNAENLLVLSGTEPTRRWGQPVGLVKVVRAAIAEAEDYTRVELLPIEDRRVTGRAVGDLVHLLSELIENATSFSPPSTKVRIAGEAAARGYVLEIEDCGIGMTDAELLAANERLANPPMIELALDRMLGFFVVGRLAKRHGLKVELRHSWYGGVTALVMVPEHVLVRDGDPAVEAPARTTRPLPADDPRMAPLPFDNGYDNGAFPGGNGRQPLVNGDRAAGPVDLPGAIPGRLPGSLPAPGYENGETQPAPPARRRRWSRSHRANGAPNGATNGAPNGTDPGHPVAQRRPFDTDHDPAQ